MKPLLHGWKLKLRFFNLYKNTFIVSFEIKKKKKELWQLRRLFFSCRFFHQIYLPLKIDLRKKDI